MADTTPTSNNRILSVDIYRGLTMLVMIFVNDLSGVGGLPWWTYHLPAEANGMTYVDWVFPGFLFAVGLSIPLAIGRRLEKVSSPWSLGIHIVTRSLSLALLGLIIANSSKLDPGSTGIGRGLWSLLAFIGGILFWGRFPQSPRLPWLNRTLKFAGLLLVVSMLALFRRKTPDGRSAWLDFSYWEILGLIGWTYLSACVLYVPLRKRPWAPGALLIGLCVMNVASRVGWLGPLGDLPIHFWPLQDGALASITMAGIVAASIFMNPRHSWTMRGKAARGLGFALIMLVAGWLLSPFGISKIRATPTWCLYCSAISTLLFLILHWVVDEMRVVKWSAFLNPAGSNTLLTYLLPDIFYAAGGFHYVSPYFAQGLPGVVKSLLFTGFILGCSAVLTRMRIRMQLR
jgi:uncharacterized membrane protein